MSRISIEFNSFLLETYTEFNALKKKTNTEFNHFFVTNTEFNLRIKKEYYCVSIV